MRRARRAAPQAGGRATGHRGTSRALRDLAALEAIARTYGGDVARRKRVLLGRLARPRLPSAAAVLRLHEALLFLLAYPDDASIRRLAERLVSRFEHRQDLRAFAPRLVNSGIAGTAIRFRFFARMARWLAERWPERLTIDWRGLDAPELLESLLPLVALAAEQPGLDEYDLGMRVWLRRLAGARCTDAAFLVRGIAALEASPALRDTLQDRLDLPMTLAPGPGGPSRTLALVRDAPLTFRRAPLARERPDLRRESLRRPAWIRSLDPNEGAAMIDRAREAMVTRSRDLDAFADADARDARLIGFDEGLAFAAIGVLPERRLLFESVYGFLTLQNGVPIGYVLVAALYGSCELAYNVFDTFRGAEAARAYGRVLALARHLFGADAFMIPPYQLGEGNDEAIASGAWWFYAKLGFEPRARQVRTLAERERARVERDPSHRSTPATLRRLASQPLFFHVDDARADVLGRVPLANVGLAVTDLIAARFAGDRARAARELEAEARARLRVRSTNGWSADERRAFDAWAPVIVLLRGVDRWSDADRAGLVAVVRAKGGRRESEFVRRFDAHAKLRRALRALAERIRARA